MVLDPRSDELDYLIIPKPITTSIRGSKQPTRAQIKAACAIVAINQNNGFGSGVGESGTASVANGIVFQQRTQYPRPSTMNPSAPNLAVLMPLAAPAIFVQASYSECLSHY